MKRAPILFLATALLTLSSSAHASCYAVIDESGNTVYQSIETPIDLSGSIRDAMAREFPGHHLTISDGLACIEIGAVYDDGDDGPNLLYDAAISRAKGARRLPGTAVSVRSYTKDNGTVVRAHTRAAPGHGAARR